MSNITNWDPILKKEARGINDYDLGEVHEVAHPISSLPKKELLTKINFISQKV